MKGWSFGALIKALRGAAFLDVGNTANTVAAGDDSRIVGSMQKSANLSDVTNVSSARNSIGLGSANNVAFASVAATGPITGGNTTIYTDAVTVGGPDANNKHVFFRNSTGAELGLVYVSPYGSGNMGLRVKEGPELRIDANGNVTVNGVANMQNNANIAGTANVGGLVSAGAVNGNYGTITTNFGVQGVLTSGILNSGDGNFSNNVAVTKTLTANKVATPYVEATSQLITGSATVNGLSVQTNATINGTVLATNLAATNKLTVNNEIVCNSIGVNTDVTLGRTLNAQTVVADGFICHNAGWFGSTQQISAGTQASIEANGDIGGLIWGNGSNVRGFLSTVLANMRPTSDGASYWRDPVTGITVQWGRLQSGTKNTPTVYTMPRAFNNRVLAVFATIGVNWAENQWIYAELNGNSNNSFMYKCTEIGVGFGWLAIGI